MSDHSGDSYKIELALGVKEQIQAIRTFVKQRDRLREFIAIAEKAQRLLQTDPKTWGDPLYRSKFVDGLYCHALLWPIAFRFVIYEQSRSVVILSIRRIADFT